ncbi:O-succinylbenzoate synthase [Liquorilactobacillus sucicola DSM 21376 = JCM 15457]|uniref:o-succinylbenzoate synthase n=1 Tax=Liquorilactobacillus sucicola DSM 21376 = JCM 15457 TaxID=1423806 RepID=A0A023CXQ3_9LACO|nr:o-succinylbenzoate synthase [Liquorilactobacillus sucicola]KRN06823.1 N-acylamino acid racemase [Liquorilactobacillus sucicola DSM 21376 = JCM 15457]GAJ26300.1 O-succinylbenzoate synthase [Liquorilactobacillus sucicola DSM 21376 = JCM 15457]
MKISTAKILPYNLKLKKSFRSAHETINLRPVTIIALGSDDGAWGYGELEAFTQPNYTSETQATARLIICEHLLPLLKKQELCAPEDVTRAFISVQGNQMAKAALETAVWDLFAKREQKSLAQLLAEHSHLPSRQCIPVGISLGAQTQPKKMIAAITQAAAMGYKRIKLKVTSISEVKSFCSIRRYFPELKFMLDANSSFSLQNTTQLRKLEEADIVMLEQPLAVTDFVEHAVLQKQLHVPLCLDENIFSLNDVRTAYQLGSAQAINLKLSRVGGLANALKIIRYCKAHHLLVWCGGMFEGGIGRATNLALASLSPLTFPGDISASDRYYQTDIITEDFHLKNGTLSLPHASGIGVTLKESIRQQLSKQPNILKRDL